MQYSVACKPKMIEHTRLERMICVHTWVPSSPPLRQGVFTFGSLLPFESTSRWKFIPNCWSQIFLEMGVFLWPKDHDVSKEIRLIHGISEGLCRFIIPGALYTLKMDLVYVTKFRIKCAQNSRPYRGSKCENRLTGNVQTSVKKTTYTNRRCTWNRFSLVRSYST